MAFRQSRTVSNNLPLVIIVSITLLSLLPFANKAFNMDDPLFIWVARQIQAHPLDFYGFHINWYGVEMSAADIIKNPPIAAYFLAAVAAIGGWSEITLHLAFLLPALTAATGTYFLAKELTHYPLAATLLAILTPAFVVSSGTVMCDTMMLAGYVWALLLWVWGIRRQHLGYLIAASFLIAFSTLTKYFGMSLIPLLLLYTLCSKQGSKQRLLFLLIPVAILLCYQFGTTLLYGRGLLLDAASYATAQKEHASPNLLSNIIIGLSFAGGCLLPTLFFAPRLWGRNVLLSFAVLVPLLALALSQSDLPPHPKTASWGYFLQLALFIVAGIHLCALACRDQWKNRNAESLLLFLWLAGTFVFATFFNWTVSGRSILPMVPVGGILVMRALDARWGGMKERGVSRAWWIALPLTCGWLVSMLVMWADYSQAGTARSAAEVIAEKYGNRPLPLLFEGHWGFQYYMEKNGAVAMNNRNPTFAPRQILAAPENNTNVAYQIVDSGVTLELLQFPAAGFVSNMQKKVGAGFYSSRWGALPYAFGNVPAEEYDVVMLR
jgi:4-amino-4-deoxy-L-arabinose transferase-like glycosyltransferase